MKPLLDAIALRIKLRLPIDAHMKRAAELICGASQWSTLDAVAFEQERRAFIDHVLVAGHSGGGAPVAAAEGAGKGPPSLGSVTTPPSDLDDAALLDAIDDCRFVEDWDAILQCTDRHAEIRDVDGKSGKRKREGGFSCAKCGHGPFASTDAVRKHARKQHPQWITGLTPSVFALFNG